ncbi:MAG: energy transducer TonB [Hyphomonas sp.]
MLRLALPFALLIVAACETPRSDAEIITDWLNEKPKLSRQEAEENARCSTVWSQKPAWTMPSALARMAEIAEAAGAGQGYDASLPAPAVRSGTTALQFPACALSVDLNGECRVMFSISPEGRTGNIMPVCTDAVFEAEAERIVGMLEFEPVEIDGVAQSRYFIVQTVQFRLED